MRDETSAAEGWQIWIDTGGTFTDCIARDPSGDLRRAKALSSSALRGMIVEYLGPTIVRVRESWNAPVDFVRGMPFAVLGGDPLASGTIVAYDPVSGIIELAEPLAADAGAAFEVKFPCEAPILAARLVTQTPPDQPLPSLALRVATTRGTNALLTRRGTPPALFLTAGFGDTLEIGTQQRADLFALNIVKPAPLQGNVIEVSERLSAEGSVLRPLDEAHVREEAARLVSCGVRTAAVALVHSYLNPSHEIRIGEILREVGFTHVSLSSALAPFIKLLPRTQTAVVNAYLAPILGAYLSGIETELPQAEKVRLHVMTSAGGLVRGAAFQPKDSLLSGPAGGVVGAVAAGRAAGFTRLIAFDMGGTSTDVARYDGDFDYVWEHSVGDAHLVAPALAIESVAAGGGSLCYADRHGGLHVGPESAGASPGPACYGAGGPLTITDVNLLLGRLQPNRFEIPLLPEQSRAAADALISGLAHGGTEQEASPETSNAVLRGLLDIANDRMADAIRRISLRRGYDPADYALVAFGGAGGQHACAVAERLAIKTVILPRDAGLLSAWGIGHASIERFAESQILRLLDDDLTHALPALFDELSRTAETAVIAEGVAPDSVHIRRRIVALRLAGQESALTIEYDPAAIPLASAFAERYAATYGYLPAAGRAIEVESIRVVAAERMLAAREPLEPVGASLIGGAAVSDPNGVYERENLRVGEAVVGPALIVEKHSTLVIEAGWTAQADSSGAILLTTSGAGKSAADDAPEAVREALFAGRFTALTDDMGEALRRTSLSTNVKERLDFSCALLDPEGRLIANAAHIPVHLGALGVCVRRVREAIAFGPGDVVITNHPAFGGSHLPDVTVISAVFDELGETLLGYVASRAHHAEIGGSRPGSMPPNATILAEEGVVLPPMYLVRAGQSRLDDICRILVEAPLPTRSLADNRSDIEAALAANRRGTEILARLAQAHSATTVWRFMEAVKARAERLLRAVLTKMPDQTYAAAEHLDDGSVLSVRITVQGDEAVIDFTGTAPSHPGNLNATPAIVTSAVLYVLRLLVREDVPLNEGLMRPVTLILPPNTLVNPHFDLDNPTRCPAVVGGNTETSQRIVDTLLKALGLAACSQGTMNNTLWGTDTFGYYETVCGGAGATPHSPGAHAVHTHMTNTRITDVEIVERRYPVRIERFARRHGSGGAGKHPGGDGIVRETVFLAPMALSVLTQHRAEGPYGVEGGESGATGSQHVLRTTGEVVELGSVDGCDVGTGDRLILETPGGGGWGEG